ncbi:MAG: cytidine deaminase [Nocardioidaceae bacterium]
MPIELPDPDDRKLLTLARATRARVGAAQGACVRDTDGRTYAGATVALDSLVVSALGVAVSMAISSGASGLEAAVVLGGGLDPADLAVVREFAGTGVPVYVADDAGTVTESAST